MSRPDTHAPEFDYHPFDFGMNPGAAHVPYGARDMPREFWQGREPQQVRESPRDGFAGPGRDVFLREGVTNTSFYHTPSASMPSASLSSMLATSAEHRPANGHQQGPGQRLHPGHALGAPAGDGWTPPTSLNGAAPGPAMAGMPTHTSVTGNPNRPPMSSVTHPVTGPQVQPSVNQKLVLNHHHHHRASPPRPPPPFAPTPAPAAYTQSDRDSFRDAFLARQFHQTSSPPSVPSVQVASLPSPNSANAPRSTLWWGELEAWMDEEYAKQVCNLMGWDPVSIKVPRPAPDPMTGRQANNPGYCFLTFPSQGHAASILAQVNSNAGGNTLSMPNSSKPFTMNWASSVPAAPMSVPFTAPTISIPGAQNPQYPKEYSIFVGDLAPEVSNSDLVAVFRNPVLGLRNDREPRFIRPFLSCKSAKIMLDPVTGVSRGYGFVRFTDEADQQRALIEMHGLYCLSRPMRISPATAKFKPMPGMPGGMDFSHMMYPQNGPSAQQMPDMQQLAMGMAMQNGTKSVSTPLASANGSSGNLSSIGSLPGSNSLSAPSLTATSSMASSATLASTPSEDALKGAHIHNTNNQAPSPPNSNVPSSISAGLAQPTHDQLMAQRYNIPEESWKHHTQARAILSNLIGPNGEQLTSSDPYNTTVFVGGLSPLISEETLRTFFVPFGEIHYVKVPVGKHCGFVQFVRKPDAERAIEKMQGFPIGGSRIRLSWGRSQYKAAQAAAQAAQAAAFQAQYTQVQTAPPNASTLTAEQAMQLLEKFGITQFLNNNSADNQASSGPTLDVLQGATAEQVADFIHQYESFAPAGSFEQRSSLNTTFSPFSPDPNYLVELKSREANASVSPGQAQSFSSTSSKGYSPWYSSSPSDEKVTASGKVSPTGSGGAQTSRPNSARAFSYLGETQQPNRAPSREGPIARPDALKRASQSVEHYGAPHDREHDSIHDLNGTLASLNLDNQGLWKSAHDGPHTSSS